ncbi:unannotated protein [freshwater metagenome]|uniref:Unannotated protein n=1 Tax=freshwater metagenome TaxID=449393 RepID=A0A6J6M1A4_9ZZZZ|nr:MBL fold metallo-hydrolase [Actinomycetota bacterium]
MALLLALFALGKGKSVIVVVACALLLGAGMMSLRQMSVQNSVLQKFMGGTATLNVQVSTDPVLTKPKVFGSTLAPASYSFLASAQSVRGDSGEFTLRIPIRVISQKRAVSLLLPGQTFTAKGALSRSKEARVGALFIIHGDVKVLTPPSRWARSLGAIRTHLRQLSGKGEGGALIPGMVLGDTSLQSSQFRDAMRRSGLTHLTAVSGANFAIISLFALWCMQWFFRKIRIRVIFTAVALSGFIALVRPSPSVLRAAAMASVVLFARAVGQRSDALPALGFAIAIVVIGDPWQARDPGFALSVLATAGLLLLAPRIVLWLSKFMPVKVAGAVSPPFAAVVMCAPILVALSGYIGPMTVIANVLVAPVVAPITVFGFIAALISPFVPQVSSFILFFVRFLASWIASVAQWASAFPVLQITTGVIGFCFTLGAVIAIFFLVKGRKSFLIALFLLVITLTWIGRWPGIDWQVANCNVGQGDSMVINLGESGAIVIDAGPDSSLVDRCLSQLGIKHIPLLILTHFHADHVEGVAGIIHRRDVGQVWVSNNAEPVFESTHIRQVLGIRAHIVIAERGLSTTMKSNRGNISLKILWPDSAEHSFDLLPGDGSAINNSSLALLLNAPDFSLFVAGDLEPPAQQQIIDSVGKVDIYKVSHHGSKYQDVGFTERLAPTLSIISVGAGNSYGHPAPQTLALLARLRSTIYRTDISGAIAVTAHEHHFKVRTSTGAWWQKVRLG